MTRPPTAPAPLPALLAAVALGGAVGAVARWGAVELTPTDTGFPWTTVAVNVSGSFALALLPAALAPIASRRRHALVTALLGPGLLGGWTTLSAYAEQARELLADGSVALAGAYVVGSLVACLAAVALGSRLVRPVVASDGVDE